VDLRGPKPEVMTVMCSPKSHRVVGISAAMAVGLVDRLLFRLVPADPALVGPGRRILRPPPLLLAAGPTGSPR
jgi:hypothetical protein